ncbi:MAG TPA: response regulator [Candidatus Hydrogenedentes bacterium]|nr:response regulator [Candidatus Hydrogenedentota bacterium]HPG68352.1 response regulator [Candidatus Hydrogenedentota bacterium]
MMDKRSSDDNDASMITPTILVVDDIDDNVRILKAFLSRRGYEVHGVHDGQAALDFVAQSPPDVILLDLVMPRVDGFEVCQRLKSNEATRHLPIIIITGVTEKEANVRALEAGADDFVLKPFDSVVLDARIRSSLRSKLLQDELREYRLSLERRVRDRTEQVRRTQNAAVFSLAKLAESRDPETGDHLERIRAYAREIAFGLLQLDKHGDVLSDEFIEDLYRSSPLHDIGKVGIPDHILLKPGRLTPEEQKIMQEHPLIGGDTLKAADIEAGEGSFLSMGRDIAYYHHEKWDGTGYPYGLKGEAIPLSGRIVAASDVYDALTSRRPYKDPFSHETSRGILLEGKGKHFDPDVVDAFLTREEGIGVIRESCDERTTFGPIAGVRDMIAALRKVQADNGPA